MRIEHVAMYVKDLEKTRDFFEKYFGAVSGAGYHNRNTDFRSYFLSFDDGARLEIMNKPGMDDAEKALARTGFAHVAFSVGSRELVDELTPSEILSELRTPRTVEVFRRNVEVDAPAVVALLYVGQIPVVPPRVPLHEGRVAECIVPVAEVVESLQLKGNHLRCLLGPLGYAVLRPPVWTGRIEGTAGIHSVDVRVPGIGPP